MKTKNYLTSKKGKLYILKETITERSLSKKEKLNLKLK